MRLDGRLGVEARGVAVFFDAPAGPVHRVVNFTGRVSFLSWESPAVVTPGPVGPQVRYPAQPPQNDTFHVEGATLEFTGREGKPVRALLDLHPESRVRVTGEAPPGPGKPSVLEAPDGTFGFPVNPHGIETIRWRWEAGWTLVGHRLVLAGFPAPKDPTLGVEGPFRGIFDGGDVTFQVPGEAPRAWRLGTWQEGALDAGNDTLGARTERTNRLVLDGEAESVDVQAGDGWAFAAPSVTWTLDGEVRWERATGQARDAEGARAFRDVKVEGKGVARIVVGSPDAAALPWRYQAEGEWTSLTIGGARAIRPATAIDPVPAAAAVSLVTLLLALLSDPGRALLGRLAGFFYTRLAPKELLRHEARRRILEEVQRDPGVHMRELHRRVGGGWGSFDFHVGMLRQGGHLLTRREGRYTAVYPAGHAPRGTPIHHPVTLRVLDLLPEDGSPVLLAHLRERAGVSRQLLAYHLKQLEKRGLASRNETDRTASRSCPPAPPAR